VGDPLWRERTDAKIGNPQTVDADDFEVRIYTRTIILTLTHFRRTTSVPCCICPLSQELLRTSINIVGLTELCVKIAHFSPEHLYLPSF
jgi:hypothetical protein